VVSFTPLSLYPRGKSHRYPLDRRLGGPQSRSGLRGRKNWCREEYNVKMYLKEITLENLCWGCGHVKSCCEHGTELSESLKGG
jgi:hypothetical protein